MSDEKKMAPEDVSEEELAIAVQLIRTARQQLSNDVEGHSVDDADSEQHFTDVNVC